jgi:hypothetical protein
MPSQDRLERNCAGAIASSPSTWTTTVLPTVRDPLGAASREAQGERVGVAPMPSLTSPRRLLVLLALGAALCLSACGSKTVTLTGANGQATTATVANIHFANTKFVLHMGLAFGAFHRYILKPLQNGSLRRGSPGRVGTLVKAALAAAFAVHELRIAREDALSSNQLRPLLNKLDNLESRLTGLIPGLKSGAASSSSINAAGSATSALGSASSNRGSHISDIAHAL